MKRWQLIVGLLAVLAGLRAAMPYVTQQITRNGGATPQPRSTGFSSLSPTAAAVQNTSTPPRQAPNTTPLPPQQQNAPEQQNIPAAW